MFSLSGLTNVTNEASKGSNMDVGTFRKNAQDVANMFLLNKTPTYSQQKNHNAGILPWEAMQAQ